jgi:hypothetical protein
MPIDSVFNAEGLFISGTIVLAIGLVLALVVHIVNIHKVHRLMGILQRKTVSKPNLYKEMTVSQGTNFTALSFSSWILLFVAIAFLYLLVPTVLPFSYMDEAELASNPMGFFIFGSVIGLIAAIVIFFMDKLPEDRRELRLTELYSFYSISKGSKMMIGLTIVFLWVSILLSAYLGTIYPEESITVELACLGLLLVSTGILVMPIYKEAWEARR